MSVVAVHALLECYAACLLKGPTQTARRLLGHGTLRDRSTELDVLVHLVLGETVILSLEPALGASRLLLRIFKELFLLT